MIEYTLNHLVFHYASFIKAVHTPLNLTTHFVALFTLSRFKGSGALTHPPQWLTPNPDERRSNAYPA
jgi:hypothetical protein